MIPKNFIPKLYSLLREDGYSFAYLVKDLMAGVVVGILSIPMSIAFAIASGARPEQGLYTAIVAGLVVGLFGGCRVQVAGPTGAFVLLIYATISQFGYEGLCLATLLAGIFLIILAVSRAGTIIKFIPYPVTIGFTSGLALLLFVNQIPDFLGLKIEGLSKEFFPKIIDIFSNIPTLTFSSLLIGGLSVFIVILWPRVSKKIPGSLVAIIVASVLVQFFNLPVDTIRDRFDEITNILPKFVIPHFSFKLAMEVVPSAIAIALLAGMEALLAAVVADGMMGRRHRSEAELLAQGGANLLSIFFGGIPATGTIARTATCIKTGGQTPFASIFNVLTMVLVLTFFGKYVSYIPMTTLAAVIMVVSYNMSEWRVFTKLFLSPKKDILVLLATFFLTVFVDLITAIEVGVILAMFLFISNLVNSSKINSIKSNLQDQEDDKHEAILDNISPQIEIFEIIGPMFFAAAEKFKVALTRINRTPKILIIRLREVNYIDATAIRALEDVLFKFKKDGTRVVLSGVRLELMVILEKSNMVEKIGKENIFSHLNEAIAFAESFVQKTNIEKELAVD